MFLSILGFGWNIPTGGQPWGKVNAGGFPSRFVELILNTKIREKPCQCQEVYEKMYMMVRWVAVSGFGHTRLFKFYAKKPIFSPYVAVNPNRQWMGLPCISIGLCAPTCKRTPKSKDIQ